MAKKSQQEFVQHITPRSEYFSQWYTDVVRLADLMDYTPVRGCMAIKPYGYGIWELIQQQRCARCCCASPRCFCSTSRRRDSTRNSSAPATRT